MRRIGPKGSGLVADVEACGVPAVRELFNLRGGIYSEKDLEYLQLDAGGAVIVGEPETSLYVRGTRFDVRLRHAPYIRRQLASLGELPDLPGFKGLISGVFMTVITVETAAALADSLDRLIRERAREISEWETKASGAREDLNQSANWATVPHCGFCQSGKPYAECCGKPTQQN